MLAVARGDAGTLVVDGEGAVVETYAHGPVGRAPLHGVVDEVGDRALERCRLTDDPPRFGVDLEAESTPASSYARDSPVDDLGQVDLLHDREDGLVAGQLDQVTDQGRHLLDLRAYVVEQL